MLYPYLWGIAQVTNFPVSLGGEMECLSPYVIKVRSEERGEWLQIVRCKRCTPCIVGYVRSWAGRLMLELQDSGNLGGFHTLTYRDVGTNILDAADIRAYMKSYRYHNHELGPCKFYAVGEYGSSGGRKHWHVLVFGHPQTAVKGSLERIPGPFHRYKWNNPAWQLGHSSIGDVDRNSVGYVAKYALKSYASSEKPVVRCSTRPEGIGYRSLQQMAASLALLSSPGRPLVSWPKDYQIGNKRYPLLDGGLACFQKAFVNSGGYVNMLNPEEQELLATYHLGKLGPRIQSESALERDVLLRKDASHNPLKAERTFLTYSENS